MSVGQPKLIQRLAAAAAGPSNSAAHTLIDSWVAPANFLAPGKMILWTGSIVQSAVNGTDTLRGRCLIGATTLTGTAVADSGTVTGAANNTMTWQLWVQILTATTAVVWGSYSILGTIGTVTHRAAYSALSSLDLTAALRFEVTGLFSAASAGNVCAAQSNVYVEWV